MDKNTVYAVVDTEATGTSFHNDDRIIQFACTFIQHDKIINHYNTLINPKCTISEHIEQLTGIKNRQLKNAPYFEDVADIIYKMLQNTVFVAHNVDFDFNFLNIELENAGYPKLEIPAVDTVSLSRILFPTASEYKLSSLTSQLNINHDRPHTADSDADATAELFISLMHKLFSLPLNTIKQLIKLNLSLPMNTNDLLMLAEQKIKQGKSKLPGHLYIKNHLVLCKKNNYFDLSITERNAKRYPLSNDDKKKLFRDNLDLRPNQMRMMNLIYKNFSGRSSKHMLIEAPVGSGKSLGYLFPLAFLLNFHHPLVVSTSTNLLQEQLLNQSIVTLKNILPFDLQVVLVKGVQHYLNLDKFNQLLSINSSKRDQLLKAKLLVWLLETETGDLDELNLTEDCISFVDQVNYHNNNELNKTNIFYEDDFLAYRNKKITTANILIVNHDYLIKNINKFYKLINNKAYLVIDEAHQFINKVIINSEVKVNFKDINRYLHKLQSDLINQNIDHDIIHVVDDDVIVHLVQRLFGLLVQLESNIESLKQELYRSFLLNRQIKNINEKNIKCIINSDQLINLVKNSRNYHDLIKLINKIKTSTQKLLNYYFNNLSKWTINDQQIMINFKNHYQYLLNLFTNVLVVENKLQNSKDNYVFFIEQEQYGNLNSIELGCSLLNTNNWFKDNLYGYFPKVLFTGATLFNAKSSVKYVLNNLNLTSDEVKIERIKNTTFYKNMHFLMVNDAPKTNYIYSDEMLAYWSKLIKNIIYSVDRPVLVLFNSDEILKTIYDRLKIDSVFEKRDLYAQFITGSKNKILQNFLQSKNAVLLGSGSYWEGINIPDNLLKVLIIPQIPFDSPNSLLIKAKVNQLNHQGHNAFYNFMLPKAILKLRQGIGRIIRSSTDEGIIITLDSRIVNKGYGKTIQGILPLELMDHKSVNNKQLLEEIKKYL